MFEAVINWVKHSKKEREASLPELLQYVRMPLLTPRYITDVIDTEVQWSLLLLPALLSAECVQSSSCAAAVCFDTVELSLLSRSAAVTLSSVCCASSHSRRVLSPEPLASCLCRYPQHLSVVI